MVKTYLAGGGNSDFYFTKGVIFDELADDQYVNYSDRQNYRTKSVETFLKARDLAIQKNMRLARARKEQNELNIKLVTYIVLITIAIIVGAIVKHNKFRSRNIYFCPAMQTAWRRDFLQFFCHIIQIPQRHVGIDARLLFVQIQP